VVVAVTGGRRASDRRCGPVEHEVPALLVDDQHADAEAVALAGRRGRVAGVAAGARPLLPLVVGGLQRVPARLGGAALHAHHPGEVGMARVVGPVAA
jgi:hypothetical protein